MNCRRTPAGLPVSDFESEILFHPTYICESGNDKLEKMRRLQICLVELLCLIEPRNKEILSKNCVLLQSINQNHEWSRSSNKGFMCRSERCQCSSSMQVSAANTRDYRQSLDKLRQKDDPELNKTQIIRSNCHPIFIHVWKMWANLMISFDN